MKKVSAFLPLRVKSGLSLLLLSSILSISLYGQGHIIGSFPEMDGGFENQSFTTAGVTATVTSPKSDYTVNNANAVLSLITDPANARTGSKYAGLTVSSNSANGVFSPTTANTITNGNSYVIQFYYKAGASTNRTFGGSLSPDGSANLGGSVTSANMNQTTWSKSSVVVTAGGSAAGTNGLFFYKYNSTTSSANSFDDIVVYPGNAEDVTAPGDPTGASAVSASGTSLTVSWTADAGGIDGGGFIVVRDVADPTTTPNANGIYAVNNTIGSGTVVYIGTGTSFVDGGLSSSATYYYRIYAADKAFNYSNAATCNGTPTLPGYPIVSTSAVSGVTSIAASCGGNVTSDGGNAVGSYGVVWSTSPMPTVPSANSTNDGSGLGAFSSSITGLSQGVTYYVRAYATNSAGTSYGLQVSFTTPGPPTVTTTAITNVSGASATSGGNVTSDGGATVTARGICWSTSSPPTIADNVVPDGTGGTGSFTSNINGLAGSTTYYVRAYATNSNGTSYGVELSFNTPSAYFNKPSADLSIPSNWGSLPNGQGTSPSDFTGSNVIYNLFNTGGTLGASLTITASGSKILLGDGINPVSFTIPAAYVLTATIDVAGQATLTNQNTTNPTFGTLSTYSTVNFDGNNVVAPSLNYYNLGLNNSANFASNTIAGVAGAFNPGNVLAATDGSTVDFNGTAAQSVPAFIFSKLAIDNTSGTATTTTSYGPSDNIQVKKSLDVNEDFTVTAPNYLTLLSKIPTNNDSCKWTIAAGRVLHISFGSVLDQQTAKSPTLPTLTDNSCIVVDGQHWMNSPNMTTHYGGNNDGGSDENEDGMAGTYTSTSKIIVLQGVPRMPCSVEGSITWSSPGVGGEETFIYRNCTSSYIGGNLNMEEGKVNVGSGSKSRTLTVNGDVNVSAGEFHAYGGGGKNQKLIVNGDVTVTGGSFFPGDYTYTSGYDYDDNPTKIIEIKGNLTHTGGRIGNGVDTVDTSPGAGYKAYVGGTYIFNGNTEQQITTTTEGFDTSTYKGISRIIKVIVNNPAGLRLNAGVFNPDTLIMTDGKITATNGTLVYPDTMINANQNRYIVTLNSGSLKHKKVANNNGTGYLFHVGISATSYNPVLLNNTGTVDNFTLNVNPTSPYISPLYTPFGVDTGVVQVQYKIEEEVQGGSDVDMKLQWNTYNIDLNESSTFDHNGVLKIGRYDGSTGGAWLVADANLTGAPVSFTGAYAATGTSTYSAFQPTYYMVGHQCAFISCALLPIGSVSFTGKENAGIVNLQWRSAEEVNLKNFVVERSIDSRNFSGIGSVAAKGSGSNNYDLDDSKAPGGLLYYRLRIVDKNGKYTYSQVVTINMKKQRTLQLYPNPVTDRLTISHAKADKNAVVSVYGFNGVRIASVLLALGSETTTINTSSYAAGVYMLKYENNSTVQTERFVKR